MASNGPAYRHTTDAEVLSDSLHAIRSSSVSRSDCLVPVSTVHRIVLQRLGDGAPLALGYLSQRPSGIDQRLHALDELLRSQVDLIVELLPRTGGVHAISDKPAVLACCRSSPNVRRSQSVAKKGGASSIPTVAR